MPFRHADAVVIGAGIIGSSIATELARRGLRTINIERLAAAGSGSTSYSSGICRMMYSVPDSVAFAWEGYTYYDRWAEHIGGAVRSDELAQFRRAGGVVLRSMASETFLSRVMESYDKVGLLYEEWGRARLKEVLGCDTASFAPPRRIDDDDFGNSSGEVSGAVFFPQCGYVSAPDVAARNLHVAATATGRAEFVFNTTVVEITRAGGVVSGVRLDDGSVVEAPVVVNAGSAVLPPTWDYERWR
jgi:sarcosine oxidase, subunit beta